MVPAAAPVAGDSQPRCRVVRLLTRPNLGGPTRQVIALWHAHRKLGVRTLLVTGRTARGEAVLSPAQAGVPVVAPDALRTGATDVEGWLELPDLRPGLAPLADRRARQRFEAVLRCYRPDVVHTHTSKAGWLGRAAARAAGVPVVAHTFHGHVLRDYFHPLFAWWLRRLERQLAARTDLLFAVSDSCAAELAVLGVAARDRLRSVPPAVELEPPRPRAAARAALGVPPGERRIAGIGRLVPIKRLSHFVDAVALLPEVRGDLIGVGPEAGRLAARAAQRAGGRVLLRGAVPEIAALLPAYDALVLPSVREGCPLVAIEAFAAGVPVIGYDVPGVRDALADIGRGVLVPVDAGPQGLAAAVRSVLAEVDSTSRMVAAARAGVDRCQPAAVAATLLDAYLRAARPDSRRCDPASR